MTSGVADPALICHYTALGVHKLGQGERAPSTVMTPKLRKHLEEWGWLASRALLALIFVASGFDKLARPTDAAALVASHGVPAPLVLAVLAGCLELVAGLCLLVGFATRWCAGLLLLFLVPVTVLFHNPAGLGPTDMQIQTTMLMKNMAIVGGLLGVIIHGPGPLSLDSARKGRVAESRGSRRK